MKTKIIDGKIIEKARQLRHEWHSRENWEAIEEIDELLGTNFSEMLEKEDEDCVKDHIEVWREQEEERITNEEEISEEDKEKLRDIQNMKDEELLEKYRDEIEESAFNMDEMMRGFPLRWEKVNEYIRDYLNNLKYEYMRQYPDAEMTKKWKEETEEWKKWQIEKEMWKPCDCGSGLPYIECCGAGGGDSPY